MKYKNTQKSRDNSKRRLITVLVAGLLLVCLSSVLVYKQFFANSSPAKTTPETSGSYSPPTKDQIQQQAAIDAANKDKLANNPDGSSTSSTSSAQIIELSAQKESNGTVTMFTKLYGYSAGTCSLSVFNGSNSISQTADIIYQKEYSSCAGFSVPIKGLGEGKWNITLKTSTSRGDVSKTLDFEVK